jgi:hypothetical protein
MKVGEFLCRLRVYQFLTKVCAARSKLILKACAFLHYFTVSFYVKYFRYSRLVLFLSEIFYYNVSQIKHRKHLNVSAVHYIVGLITVTHAHTPCSILGNVSPYLLRIIRLPCVPFRFILRTSALVCAVSLLLLVHTAAYVTI